MFLIQQVPVLETPNGPLTESSAIARYLASLSATQTLYPQSEDPSDTTRALIDAWVDWAIVLDTATKSWVEPMFGEGPQQPAAVDAAKAEFEKALQTLNIHLGLRTYLVGESITLADLVVVSHLLLLYLTVSIATVTAICFGQHYVYIALCSVMQSEGPGSIPTAMYRRTSRMPTIPYVNLFHFCFIASSFALWVVLFLFMHWLAGTAVHQGHLAYSTWHTPLEDDWWVQSHASALQCSGDT